MKETQNTHKMRHDEIGAVRRKAYITLQMQGETISGNSGDMADGDRRTNNVSTNTFKK